MQKISEERATYQKLFNPTHQLNESERVRQCANTAVSNGRFC
jgi:hypothetical protein